MASYLRPTFPAPDREQIAAFVWTLFLRADPGTCVSLRAFYDALDGAWNPQLWSTVPIASGSDQQRLDPIIEAAVLLARRCAEASEPVVFAAPIATFLPSAKADTKSLSNGLTVVAELDQHPDDGLRRLKAALGPASIVIASGGTWCDHATGEVQDKVHAHWRLLNPTRNAIEHDLLREVRRLAACLVGGDASASSPVHPLRWPGTWHRKQEPPRLARIVEINAQAEISLTDALNNLRVAVEDDRTAQVQSRRGPEKAPTAIQAAIPDVVVALGAIPNNDVPWDIWNWTGMATYASTGGTEEGFTVWANWSAKSSKHDAMSTRDRWDHFHVSPPSRLGFGSLVYRARQYHPDIALPSEATRREHREAAPAADDARLPPSDSPHPNGHDNEAISFGAESLDRASNPGAIGADTMTLSFRDPWLDPLTPDWPADVLPIRYSDMVFELADAGGVDPGAQSIATLCAISGAAPKNDRFYPYGCAERWSVPPIIWAMVVAISGQRKTALNLAFEPLQRRQRQLWQPFHAALREWYSLPLSKRSHVPKPAEPHSFVIDNATVEAAQIVLANADRGTMLLKDELAGFFGFGRYGKEGAPAERSFYLESYEGGPYTVLRVSRDSLYISVNGLTIFGHIQPDRLTEFPGLENDGLLQRFMPILPARASAGRALGVISGKAEYDANITRLTELTGGRSYQTTPEGGDIIRQMEKDAIDYSTIADYGIGFQGFCSKLHGTTARIAQILNLLDDPDVVVIPTDIVERADRIVRRFVLPHAIKFYATISSKRVEIIRTIAGWLLTKAPTRIRASDFSKHIRACRELSLKQLNEVLEPLVTGGWLEPKIPFPTNREWRLIEAVRGAMAHRAAAAAERREEIRRLWERISSSPKEA
jgi:hypothetical protein